MLRALHRYAQADETINKISVGIFLFQLAIVATFGAAGGPPMHPQLETVLQGLCIVTMMPRTRGTLTTRRSAGGGALSSYLSGSCCSIRT